MLMKKLIPVFAITAILLSQAIVSSYGKENNENKNSNAEVKIEVKNNKNEIKIKNEENEVEIGNENKNRIKIKIENDKGEFKIWGPIQSFDSSSLTIDGKTIEIDTTITEEFKQVGTLNIGMYAKVEGVIINDAFYAEKIVVDQRNKNDLDEDDDEVSPTPSVTNAATPTVTTTPSISITPTVIPSGTPSITPTATETPLLQGSNNNVFILDQLILKLERLIGSLLKLSN